MQPREARFDRVDASAVVPPSGSLAGVGLERDRLLLEGLRPASLGLAALFVVFLISGLLGFPHETAFIDVLSDSVLVVAFGVLWVLLSRSRIPLRWAHPVGFLVAALVQANILLAFALFGTPASTLYSSLLLIGVATLGVSLAWMTAAVVAILGSWAMVAMDVLSGEDLASQSIAMCGATLVTIIMIRARLGVQALISRLLREKAEHQSRVEGLLAQSQSRYRQIVELALEGISVVDPDGVITYSNDRFGQLLGRRPEDLLGRSLLTIVAPEDQEQVVRRWATRAAGGREVYEVRYLRHDGEPIHCMVSASPLFDEDGRHLGNLGLVSDITSRVRAEDALRHSERDYRHLFEGAHDAILIIDPETEVVLEANRRACEVYGRRHHEMIGTCLKGISVDPSRGREHVRTTVSLKEGAVHRFETAQLRTDGSTMYLDVSASLVNFRGEAAILTINRDITEGKDAAEALRSHHARLGILGSIWRGVAQLDPPRETARTAIVGLLELVACVHGAVILFDPGSRVGRVLCFVGDNGEEMEGSEVGRNAARELHEVAENPDQVTVQRGRRCALLSAAASDQVDDAVCVIAPLRAGERTIGQLHLRAERSDEITDRHLEVIAEISGSLALALREAELREALEGHQQRLEALVQHLPEGVVFLDATGRVQLVNSEGATYLSVLAGVGVGDAVTHLGGQPLDEFEGAQDDVPTPLLVAVPPQRMFEASILALDEGAAKGSRLLVLREVTRELEHRRQLEQQDRVRVVGQLAAGIAHDFNNILQAVVGFAESARASGDTSPTLTRQLDGILSQARRGARLVRQILDFTRRSVSERHAFDLGSVVKETVDIFAQSLPTRIDLMPAVEVGPHHVLGDVMQLQQVISNLLTNARDAIAERGEIRVEVSRLVLEPGETRPLEQMAPGRWEALRVCDTGCGMSRDVLGRVFEPFFTTKPSGEGTGLGLSQVYGIVKQHGGFVVAESVEGEGSSVSVYLPHQRPGSEADQAIMGEPAQLGQGKLALVVEDEAMVLEAVRTMLEAHGFNVIPAAGGRKALQIFAEESEEIAVVISDVMLPDLGGVEVLERIRGLSPSTPAVLMSGFPQSLHVGSVLSTGGIQWLAKPFDADQLARVMARALASGSTT